MIGIGMVTAIALVVCLVPLVTVAYEVTVDYEDTETYYEDEPYEATETYYETNPLDYHIVEYHEGYAMENLPPGANPPCAWALMTLLNTDTASGTFTVRLYLTVERLTPVGEDRYEFVSNDYQDTKQLHLEPGQIGTWQKYWTEIDLAPEDNCRWGYDIAGSNTTEKQRTVTRYRQVEKQRTVTKQRQETRYKKVTLLDYLLHY